MNVWKEIWERKGNDTSDDLILLNGYEATKVEPKMVVQALNEALQIKPTDRLLEVGCGAGMLAQHFDCEYVGMDYSASLVKKHIEILKNSVLVGEAGDLPFKDRSFDKVVAFGIFHYFPSLDYAARAMNEMLRVTRQAVFIGDIPLQSHSTDHLLYTESFFKGWQISPGIYYPHRPFRFNAMKWI